MTSTPVTVIVPALDCAATIAAALASVRDQSLADLEVIVVDAGSRDSTVDIVRACMAADPRIRLVAGQRRLSAPAARNAGLASATGEFIAFLDSDDLMLPDRLQVQVARLRDDASLAAVGGILMNVDQDGVGLVGATSYPRRTPITGVRTRYVLAFRSPCVTSSLTLRADSLRLVGGFDESLPYADDYDLLWRVTLVGAVAVEPRVVGRYRHHAGQISTTRWGEQFLEVQSTRRRIAEAVLGRPPAWSTLAAWIGYAVGEEALHMAREDLLDYDRAFRLRHEPQGDDDRWIAGFLSDRLEALTAGGSPPPAANRVGSGPLSGAASPRG